MVSFDYLFANLALEAWQGDKTSFRRKSDENHVREIVIIRWTRFKRDMLCIEMLRNIEDIITVGLCCLFMIRSIIYKSKLKRLLL